MGTLADNSPGPEGAYWEDPVYRYLSRLHREGRADEVDDLEGTLQRMVDGSIDPEVYASLADAAREARRRDKAERKQKSRGRGRRPAPDAAGTSINTAELKKRIFNPRVSKANMIKAIEALPPGERKATIEGLPPGLKRKLGKYLDG